MGSLSLSLDLNNRIILLLDQHRHLLEHLGKFRDGFLDLLDLLMTFLYFSDGTSSSTVTIRAQ